MLQNTKFPNAQGANFSYTVHEVVEKGFMLATPWKQRSMGLNEGQLPAHLIREVGEDDSTRSGFA